MVSLGKAMFDAISKEACLYGFYKHFEARAFLRKTEHAILLGVSPEKCVGTRSHQDFGGCFIGKSSAR